jgi:tripeptide aminopeptidase
MEKDKLSRLKEILSIPTHHSNNGEEKLRNFIIEWATIRGLEWYVDRMKNVYITKGSSDFYPCVAAHIDSVHQITPIHIEEEIYDFSKEFYDKTNDGKLVVRGYKEGLDKTKSNRTGCGGDDKCGVFLALELIDKFDNIKGAFFVSEEIGCVGSRQADPEFFKNVAYTIQHDSPENDTISWFCSGYQLFTDDWASPNVIVDENSEERFNGLIGDLLYKHGVRVFARHPYTDVSQIRQKFDFQCINLPAAYYRYHTKDEYVLIEGIEVAEQLSVDIIERLGCEKQFYVEEESETNNNGGWANYYQAYGYGRVKPSAAEILKSKVKSYFIKKYAMTDDDFNFLYEGLHNYVDEFTEKSVSDIVNEYFESPFYS